MKIIFIKINRKITKRTIKENKLDYINDCDDCPMTIEQCSEIISCISIAKFFIMVKKRRF